MSKIHNKEIRKSKKMVSGEQRGKEVKGQEGNKNDWLVLYIYQLHSQVVLNLEA